MSTRSRNEVHLWVNSLPKSVEFYSRALGFSVVNKWPEENPTWVLLEMSGQRLQLSAAPGEPSGKDPELDRFFALIRERMGQRAPFYIAFSPDDLEAHHANAKLHRVEVVTELKDRWWGWREYTVVDPDGTWLVFYRDLG